MDQKFDFSFRMKFSRLLVEDVPQFLTSGIVPNAKMLSKVVAIKLLHCLMRMGMQQLKLFVNFSNSVEIEEKSSIKVHSLCNHSSMNPIVRNCINKWYFMYKFIFLMFTFLGHRVWWNKELINTIYTMSKINFCCLWCVW